MSRRRSRRVVDQDGSPTSKPLDRLKPWLIAATTALYVATPLVPQPVETFDCRIRFYRLLL